MLKNENERIEEIVLREVERFMVGRVSASISERNGMYRACVGGSYIGDEVPSINMARQRIFGNIVCDLKKAKRDAQVAMASADRLLSKLASDEFNLGRFLVS
jgi:hypothetical protein